MDASIRLARRTDRMAASAIREILKVTERPGIISLAGGLPAPESFPTALMADLTDRVLSRYGAAALQYGPSEGFGPLREALAVHLEQRGIAAAAGDILITSGSQGALCYRGKVPPPVKRLAPDHTVYVGTY